MLKSKNLYFLSRIFLGPQVISRQITVEHLINVGRVSKRKPLIWDNLLANDYGSKRLFLGPYIDRSTDIKYHSTGVVINPNCEFEANFVALHTLAQWNRCFKDFSSDSSR